MTFTQETIPKTPQEAGIIMAAELLENLEEYCLGSRSSFYAVFCPSKGQTPIHDIGLQEFLNGLSVSSIEADTEQPFLHLDNGIKLFYSELKDSDSGEPYQVTFSTEPII